MHPIGLELSNLVKRSLPQPPVTHSTASATGRSRTRSDNPTMKRDVDYPSLSSPSAVREKSRVAPPANEELDLTVTNQELHKSSL